MARQWTCRKCKRQWPRVKRLCICGTRRPAPQTPAHKRVLVEVPYERWVAVFGERCNICGREPGAHRRLDRDHDHASGLPRGTLCFRCNKALPNWMTPEWLRSAAEYLERPAVELERAA